MRRLRSALAGLRARLLLWYLALFVVTLAVAVVALRQLLIVQLNESIAHQLAKQVEQLQLIARGNDPATGEPFGNDVTALFDAYLASNVSVPGEVKYFLVDGVPHTTSGPAPVDLMADPGLVTRWAETTEPTYGRQDTAEGPVRWLATPVDRGGQTLGTFVAAQFYGQQLEGVTRAVRLMAVLSAVALVLATTIGWFTVGRALAPVARLTRTARTISDSDLTQRLPVTGHDEVAEMSSTFNSMLDRLETAFADQRRFLDDVGHELRTPLTIVRGNLELMPDDPAEREQTIVLCLDELDRMNRYVSELILIARARKPDFLRVEPVDLAELTEGMLDRAVALAPDRDWQAAERSTTVIEADPDRLNQAWLNLVTNAVQHTEPGGRIVLGSQVVGEKARLWVADDGPGIAEAEQATVFDRFHRGAGSAESRPEGTGLGLAIVSAIAAAHGGTASLRSSAGSGACFTLEIPVAQPTDHDDDDTVEVTR